MLMLMLMLMRMLEHREFREMHALIERHGRQLKKTGHSRRRCGGTNS
jgi:hypothetical protein